MTEARPYFLDRAALAALPAPGWLLRGLVPDDSFGVLFGPSGGFKTFLAVDLALSVATGVPWNGHEVTRAGTVVYIAAEGRSGLLRRVEAWEQARTAGNPVDRMQFLIEPVNFRDAKQVHELKLNIGTLDEQPRLLVIDTLARSMVGGDENSSRDIGEFIDAVSAVPADVRLVIHHTGHNGGHERGSSALQGAADFRVRVERSEQLVEVSCVKLKDADEWAPITLRLEPQACGSCVLVPVSRPEVADERATKVLAWVRENGPVSGARVRQAVRGRAKLTDEMLKTLERRGALEHTGQGWIARPDPADAVGRPSPEANGRDASAGGEHPVGVPPRDALVALPFDQASRAPDADEPDGSLVQEALERYGGDRG
jgi:hypothetical protein